MLVEWLYALLLLDVQSHPLLPVFSPLAVNGTAFNDKNEKP